MKNETANGENNYSLNKIENYKKNIDSVNEIIEKYSDSPIVKNYDVPFICML
jgi:hypothetical protein